MNLIWFYIAIILAISDIIHTQIMWKIANNFYILLGGIIRTTVKTPLQTWLVHEIIEAIFHLIILSIVFLDFKIGILAACIHFILDVTHTMLIKKHMNALEHRAIHFTFESIFFIIMILIGVL